MQQTSTRKLVIWLMLVAVTAFLYQFWLTYTVLRHLTFSQWRTAAILVVVVLGIGSALVRLPAYVFASAITIGLLFGGTWAELSVPRDVPTTFFAELTSHLQNFWREVLLFIAVSTAGHLCITHLLYKNRATR